MANLIVELGNTALKAAWCEGTSLGKTFRYQGEKVIDYLLTLTEKEKPEILTVSTVYHISTKDEAILKHECTHLLILDKNHTETLKKYNLPDYISYDRAAGIVAASYLFKNQACTIFDFGTTLTIDFITTDGTYKGGNISPGCRTRFKSLNRYSKSLPLIDTPESIESDNNSLKTSIEKGVILGIIFEIEAYIKQNPQNIIVFTGGDAIYFANRIKNSIFAICNLVLMGLAIITDDYAQRDLT